MAVPQDLTEFGIKESTRPDKRTLLTLLERGREHGLFAVRHLTVPAHGLGTVEQKFVGVFRNGDEFTEELARQVLSSQSCCKSAMQPDLVSLIIKLWQ